jgi:hypothetical protein
MTLKNVIDCEKKSFHNQMKELKLLPHKYFKIGIVLTIASFVGVISLNIMGDYVTAKLIIKNLMLVSVLMIAISKDKEEDEMTLKLRSQAFVFAFIWGVLYAAAQPFINMAADFFISDENKGWTQLSVNQVLFFMLMIQLSFYHFSKRMR